MIEPGTGTRDRHILWVRQAIVVAGAVAASAGAIIFDWCDRLCMALSPYEAYEADEYLLVLLFLALGLLAALALRERHLRLELVSREVDRQAAMAAARTDFLTGLPNRLAIAEHMAATAAIPSAPVAILLLDLDGFKGVNDTFGHDAGDDVLRTIARRLAALCEQDAALTAFRLGGDEFALIRRGPIPAADLHALSALLLACITDPITLDVGVVSVSGSIGVASADGVGSCFETALKQADTAMFAAKRSRAGGICFAHHAGEAPLKPMPMASRPPPRRASA